MKKVKRHVFLVIKGVLMGAANVIPGVSGGTMALLTGIFEPFIRSIKSFDLYALKLIVTGKFKTFAVHVQFDFLFPVGIGIFLSILSFARLLEYLFNHHALYVWSFFFGLILASVFFVLKRIRRFTFSVSILFFAGIVATMAIAFLPPTEENASIPYLFLCGVIAMCGMILPGLSGSYVLLLMGNYQLIMIDSIVHLNVGILLPVVAGAAVGLIIFSRLLTWVFKRFHDATISLLTGLIFGSLGILWPWKSAIIQCFERGDQIKEKVIGYTYALPEWNGETIIALAVMAMGVVLLTLIESKAA